MKKGMLLVAALICHQALFAQCKLNYANYNLVLEENFDHITSINQLRNVWQFHHDDPGWGWGDYTDPNTGVTTNGEYYDESQVTIQPGGFLRLTAVRNENLVPIWSNWKGDYRYCRYKSGMIQLRNDLWGGIFDQNASTTGFLYGMFEIRVKLPKSPDCFPAFWLTRAGSKTEIDMFEYGENQASRRISNNIIDYSNLANITSCQHFFDKLSWDNLPELFHTISCVWTPDRVTIFFDGREMRTVDKSQMQTYNDNPLSLVANLAMRPYFSVGTTYMDIDYIRVYKPRGNDYRLPYKTANEYMPHEVNEHDASYPANASSAPNSIAINPTNPNEIFYRGTDDYMYTANNVGGHWQVTRLEFNDGPPSLVSGDVRYLPLMGAVLYVGANNRINLFGRSSSIPCGFYHWYLTSNWSCYWCVTDDYVAQGVGTLQVADNGDVFFKGTDSRLHRYYFPGSSWAHEILDHNPNTSANLVKGDIVIEPNTNHPFYKATNNDVQYFWHDASGYHHSNVTNATTYPASGNPCAFVYTPHDGLFYIGSDNKIQNFNWNSSTSSFDHSWIPYTYSAPSLGYPNADLARGGLAWDEQLKRLFYVGYDGRILAFGKSGSSWWHTWIDDYWPSDEYGSYNSSVPVTSSGSIIMGSDGPEKSIFYTAAVSYSLADAQHDPAKSNNAHIAYFKYEPCEILNPKCSGFLNLNKPSAGGAAAMTFNKDRFALFPNPVSAVLHIRDQENTQHVKTLKVMDMSGKTLLQRQNEGELSQIDLSALSGGLYLLEVSDGQYTWHYRFAKNK